MDANQKMKRYERELQKREEEILETMAHLEQENEEMLEKRYGDWMDWAWDESEMRISDHLEAGLLG